MHNTFIFTFVVRKFYVTLHILCVDVLKCEQTSLARKINFFLAGPNKRPTLKKKSFKITAFPLSQTMNKLLNEAARTIPPSVVKEDWKKRLLPEAKSGHSIWRNPPARKLRKKVKMLYTRAKGVYTDRAYLRFCKLKKTTTTTILLFLSGWDLRTFS